MNTDPLCSRVRSTLDQQQCFSPQARIVAAVSGGPDSLCLLHVLWRLQHEGGPMIHVAHLDHRFRGEQSAAEARFVAQTAQDWGLPATIKQYDVPALAHTNRQNKQDAARTVRYTFLAQVALDTGAHAVAVAHHADDQAETVLLHLLHGAGPAGLRGMRAAVSWEEWCQGNAYRTRSHTPLLLRPLLDTTRAEIECYCADHALTPCDDPSNASTHYTRNRIRADLLPTLTAYNPHITAALGRTAQICSDDYAYIQTQLDLLWPDLTGERTGAVHFRARPWTQLHPALQRYALRRAARSLIAQEDLSYEQIEAGRVATTRFPGYQQTLAGDLLLRVEHHGFLVIHRPTYSEARADTHHRLPQLTATEQQVAVPGITPISVHWNLTTSYTQPETMAAAPLDAEATWQQWHWWVILDTETLDWPLLLRRRQPGDRFRPAGGLGSRRVQDFFVDSKVPRELRAAWPLLATATRIVWVAGLRADARFQVTDNTQYTLWVVLTNQTNQMGEDGA